MEYRLEETISPRGYLGLTAPISFNIQKAPGSDEYVLTSWNNANDAGIAGLDPATGKPVPKTDPITGEPIPKTDPETGEPLLKTDPETGEPIPVLDPDTNEPVLDDQGNPVYEIEYEYLPDDDKDPSDGKNWAEYNENSEILVATIDVYNKPFTLSVVKADSADKQKTLAGAHFELYKSVVSSIAGEIKDFHPMTGYEDLITNSDGVIPGIDESLIPQTYYLTETQAPADYEMRGEDIVFEIMDNGEIVCDERYLDRREETVDGALHVTFTISIPNVHTAQAYYFDIEKIILVDQFVHDSTGSDPSQKFVFAVEHFADEEAYAENRVSSTFYVTLNCENEPEEGYPYALSDDGEYHFAHPDARGDEVTILCADVESYTFPAAVRQGRGNALRQRVPFYGSGHEQRADSTDLFGR